MDLVSVIIPYFQKRRYIDFAIKSVLEQSYLNYEIIIIYDDVDKADLNYLNQKYSHIDKIKILENEKNLGAGASRNKGIEYSKGEYIAFLDADDYWEKDKLFKQLEFMKKKLFSFTHLVFHG